MALETFAQIEEAEGIRYDKAEATRSALSAWYDSVREKRFSDFSMGDWCRSVRQEMYLEYILGYVLAELGKDPLAGDMYEGELANALALVSNDRLSSKAIQTSSDSISMKCGRGGTARAKTHPASRIPPVLLSARKAINAIDSGRRPGCNYHRDRVNPCRARG